MGRKYSEAEAWAILFGGFVIGVVLASVFWAYAVSPDINEELNQSALTEANLSPEMQPRDFVDFCRKIKGKPEWDNTGLKRCMMEHYDQRNLILMNVLCKKYGLILIYGSFGVKCEGISKQ